MTSERRNRIMQRILARCIENPETGCLEWQGPTSGKPSASRKSRGHGYPRMSLDGKTVAVHIVVATHYFGYLPSTKQVDHKCNNRLCVLHAHLQPLTHKQNQRRRRKVNKNGAKQNSLACGKRKAKARSPTEAASRRGRRCEAALQQPSSTPFPRPCNHHAVSLYQS